MSSLEKSALKAINDFKMLDKGDRIIVALSGGADSVALLNFLLSIKEEFALTLMAVHINHNLRGEESNSDERFVRELCAEKNVELFVKSIDIDKIARETKVSTELCGRNERYNYFKELSTRFSAKIATAHTASDNTETVLFNLTRGTGLKGMTGISPVREYIIRPLIYVTRTEVEEYCTVNNYSFVTDSSNLTDDYTRNKIRHNAVPCLKEINPELDSTILRNSRLFSDYNDYICQQVQIAISKAKTDYGYDADYLCNLHPALLNSVVYRICKDDNIDIEYCHIQLIVDCLKNSGSVDLQGTKRAVVKQRILRFLNSEDKNITYLRMKFSENMSFEINNKKYEVAFSVDDNKKNLINPELLGKNLFFRMREPGDVFTLPQRNVTKSLKKLFNELKIPAEKRHSLLLLTDGSVIYWIESVGVSKQGISNSNSGIEITVTT